MPYDEQPFFLIGDTDLDLNNRMPTTKWERVCNWADEHQPELFGGCFIAVVGFLLGLVIWSNNNYHLPVYELEVAGHRCIGTHQTIDLTTRDGKGSIVRCDDGSVFPNAVNVRYIRLIKPGYYFE